MNTNPERARRPRARLPIVVIGAAEGRLRPLERFLSRIPSDSGMAFVVAIRSGGQQPYRPRELLGSAFAIPVLEASEGTRIEPDRVYLVAAGRPFTVHAGSLLPANQGPRSRPQLPIDCLFSSLARLRKDQAIGILLSGTGTDGLVGITEIKAALGTVMVERDDAGNHEGMLGRAIATGLVDHAASAEELADRLVPYARKLTGNVAPAAAARAPLPGGDALRRLFELLRERCGQDFSQYRPETILRRIQRRIDVRHLPSLESYVEVLGQNSAELDLLFNDLLIGVTWFFRDPKAFDALADLIASDLATKPDAYTFRTWIPGCSTGEEAYSIAILLREALDREGRRVRLRMFATDLDRAAIDAARVGVYPLGISAHVAPERLRRFFVREGDTYRVTGELRDTLVFARQNVIEDPPIGKLDLLSCRNLLMYVNTGVQRRILSVFHSALNPDGILFLGPAEGVGRTGHLFETVNPRWRIFRRRNGSGH